MDSATSPSNDLATQPALLREVLVGMGLAHAGSAIASEPLTGGVSSSILRVQVDGQGLCVKQALPRLKVAKDWRVPVDRVFAEIAWLRTAGAIVPGHVPQVLGEDAARGAFAMPYLAPDRHPNWKQRLLAGEVDAVVAARLGDVLGRIHAATANDPALARRFANDGNFFALRLEPYLVEAARVHNDRAVELIALVHATQNNPCVLVHGDVSPKNILLGPEGPVLLDAECAWYGDAAFDLAFVLNHFLLKIVHLPKRADRLAGSFEALVQAYAAHIAWEPREAVLARTANLLPGLLLARVDGKSPVEYLDEVARGWVRGVARSMLEEEPWAAPADVLRGWLQARR